MQAEVAQCTVEAIPTAMNQGCLLYTSDAADE